MKTKIVLFLFFSLALCSKLTAQFSFTNMQDVVNNEKKYSAKNHNFYETVLTENGKKKVKSAVEGISSLSSETKNKLITNVKTAGNYKEVKKSVNESNLSKDEKTRLQNYISEVQRETENKLLKDSNQIQNSSENYQPEKYIFSKEEKEKIVTKINSLSTNDKEKLISSINAAENFGAVQKVINESALNDDEKIDLESFSYNLIKKTEEERNAVGDRSVKVFFPARFNHWGSELSTIFFEGNPKYTQFFQNNNVVYNPNLRNLSFNSEVVNDYLGPLRIGIGFQFNSTVKDNDSLATAEVKKDELVSSLQNGGGNLFINIKYPIIGLGQNSAFGLKAYAYHNTGVELTKINEADNEFVLTNNTGVAIGGFAVGHKGRISGFFEAKAALLYGNSRFNKILSTDEDFKKVLPLFNIGVGVNFLDMYTVKAEFYPAGSYIKRNFPATISFIIVPKVK